MMKENLGLAIEVMDETIIINGAAYENLGSRPLIALARAVEEYLHDASRNLDGSFHQDVYWPEKVGLAVSMVLSRRHQMTASQHCLQRLFEHGLSETAYMPIWYGEVVIARFDHGNLVQVVTRSEHRHQAGKDLVGAFQLFRNKLGTHYAKCLTVWVNDSDDRHDTLNKSRYVQAPVVEPVMERLEDCTEAEAEEDAIASPKCWDKKYGHRAAASSFAL